MSGYNRQQYEQAIQKLQSLGLHRSDIQDYYKIPTNNLNLENVESVHPTKGDKNDLAMEVLVIDSRERNYNLYPFPHEYQIETGIYIKNVKSIELTALTIPKTEYNVQDENKHIPWGFMSSPSVNYTSVITPGQYTSIGLQNINSTTPNGEIILNQPFVWGLLKEVEDQ